MNLCEVCNLRPALHVCRICGRRVCEEHYDESRGICVICASSLCEICKERLAITFCPVCGRLICYEDSVQVDNVRRVCRECFDKGFRGPVMTQARTFVGGPVRLARRVVTLGA
ncbi:MAG: hypothetical protein ACP5FT_02885 [Acidilobus sp.]